MAWLSLERWGLQPRFSWPTYRALKKAELGSLQHTAKDLELLLWLETGGKCGIIYSGRCSLGLAFQFYQYSSAET